jgi:outer membrane protein OmpA-like peptidoglycan-associated protein
MSRLSAILAFWLSLSPSNAQNVAPPEVAPCDASALAASELLGIVLFDEGDATLGVSARAASSALLAAARQEGYAALLIVGHADNAGSEGNNVLLSGRRATAVLTFLAPVGGAIALRPMSCGESQSLIGTSSRRLSHDRRVELRGVR